MELGSEVLAMWTGDRPTVLDRSRSIARFRAASRTTAALRAERRRVSREVAGASRAAVLGLACDLLGAGIPRFVAYEIVLSHPPTMSAITEAEVRQLAGALAHWGDIDAFACLVSGPAWRSGRLRDGVVRSWAASKDWRWRRVALVSTVPLNSRARGGAGDAGRTLAICRLLVDDRMDLVVKALSWALRELAKRDPESAGRFLSEHRGTLAARVTRELENKLRTGLKNPRRPRARA